MPKVFEARAEKVGIARRWNFELAVSFSLLSQLQFEYFGEFEVIWEEHCTVGCKTIA
jgi:hypothetical protein